MMGLDVKAVKVMQGSSLPRRGFVAHSSSLGRGPRLALGLLLTP